MKTALTDKPRLYHGVEKNFLDAPIPDATWRLPYGVIEAVMAVTYLTQPIFDFATLRGKLTRLLGYFWSL